MYVCGFVLVRDCCSSNAEKIPSPRQRCASENEMYQQPFSALYSLISFFIDLKRPSRISVSSTCKGLTTYQCIIQP